MANVRHVDPELLQNRRGGRGRGVAVPAGRPRGWRPPPLPSEVTRPIEAPTLSMFQPAAVAHARRVWREWWQSPPSLAVDLQSDLEAITWWIINVFRRALYFQVVRESPLATGSQGQPVRNPLNLEIRMLTADINRAADRFGMDPLGRFRLHFEQVGERAVEDDDDVDEALGVYRSLLAERVDEDDDVA